MNFPANLIAELGFKKERTGSSRFKARDTYTVPSGIDALIIQLAQEKQSVIDKIAEDLYS